VFDFPLQRGILLFDLLQLLFDLEMKPGVLEGKLDLPQHDGCDLLIFLVENLPGRLARQVDHGRHFVPGKDRQADERRRAVARIVGPPGARVRLDILDDDGPPLRYGEAHGRIPHGEIDIHLRQCLDPPRCGDPEAILRGIHRQERRDPRAGNGHCLVQRQFLEAAKIEAGLRHVDQFLEGKKFRGSPVQIGRRRLQLCDQVAERLLNLANFGEVVPHRCLDDSRLRGTDHDDDRQDAVDDLPEDEHAAEDQHEDQRDDP